MRKKYFIPNNFMKQIEHFLKCSDLSQETWFAYLYEVTRSILPACIYAKTYFSSHSRGLRGGGGTPSGISLKLCQIVDTLPKGLNIIIFFGFDILLWTLWNFQKMKKCVFPAILRVVLKVILTQSPAFTKLFKKILITQFCSACSTLREDIFFFSEKNLFCSIADWKTCLCP